MYQYTNPNLQEVFDYSLKIDGVLPYLYSSFTIDDKQKLQIFLDTATADSSLGIFTSSNVALFYTDTVDTLFTIDDTSGSYFVGLSGNFTNPRQVLTIWGNTDDVKMYLDPSHLLFSTFGDETTSSLEDITFSGDCLINIHTGKQVNVSGNFNTDNDYLTVGT